MVKNTDIHIHLSSDLFTDKFVLCFDSLMSYPYWTKLDTGFEIQIFKNIMSPSVGT